MKLEKRIIGNIPGAPLGGKIPRRRIEMGVTPVKSEAKKTPIIAGFFPKRFEIAGAKPTPTKRRPSRRPQSMTFASV